MSAIDTCLWGDCRLPQDFILTKRMAFYLSIPHLCTDEHPCPSRNLTKEDI